MLVLTYRNTELTSGERTQTVNVNYSFPTTVYQSKRPTLVYVNTYKPTISHLRFRRIFSHFSEGR